MDSNEFVRYSDLDKYGMPWDVPGVPILWNEVDDRIIPVTPAVIRALAKWGILVECFLSPRLLGRDVTREEFLLYSALNQKAVRKAMTAWREVGFVSGGHREYLKVFRHETTEAVIHTLWPKGA